MTLRTSEARLREGTEILRTGGGVHLTAGECNALLDEIQRLRAALGAYRSALRSGEPESDQMRRLGEEALR